MAEQADTDTPATHALNLNELRGVLREELLKAADAIGDDNMSLDEWLSYGELVRRLAVAYTALGGDLELGRPAQRPSDELLAALKRLNAATEDLSLEDFPPRLEALGRAVNAVLEAPR